MSLLDPLLQGYRTIANAVGALTRRSTLAFLGDGVTVTDDAANDRTVVTIETGMPAVDQKRLVGRDEGDTGAIALGDGLAFTGNDELEIADGGVALAKLEDAARYRVVGRVDSGSGPPTYLTPAQLISVLNQATSTSISLLGGNYTAVGDPTGGTVGMLCQLAPDTRVRNASVTNGNTLGLTAPGASVGSHLEVVFQVVVTTTDQEERLYFKTLRATAFRGASSEELTDVEITPIDDPYFDSTEHSFGVAVFSNTFLRATYTNNSGGSVRATIIAHTTSLSI